MQILIIFQGKQSLIFLPHRMQKFSHCPSKVQKIENEFCSDLGGKLLHIVEQFLDEFATNNKEVCAFYCMKISMELRKNMNSFLTCFVRFREPYHSYLRIYNKLQTVRYTSHFYHLLWISLSNQNSGQLHMYVMRHSGQNFLFGSLLLKPSTPNKRAHFSCWSARNCFRSVAW